MSLDPDLWTVRKRFGAAGGPDEVVLTEEGRARAFSVGARVRRGDCADALEALAVAGGEGPLATRRGSHLDVTALGSFGAIAWPYLRDLGYVERIPPDGVRLTEAGRLAVADGYAEREWLLERCQRAAAAGDQS